MMFSRLRIVPVLLLFALAAALPARATTLQDLSLDALVAESRLIFVGEALRSEVEEADGLLYTRVWFRVDTLVAGDAPEPDFSLRFVGGSSATLDVAVAGQYVPAVGDHALWFVRNPYDPMVNPLTGWHQGAFLVATDAEGQRVLDLSQRPDLILLNAQGDPLARKMLDAGFDEARIAARVPDYQRFLLDDFIAVIQALAEPAP